jgi:phosphopantetheinyl transferase
LEFSISHAGKYAAAAISDGPVGADIEEARCKLSVARRFFSASEAEAAQARSGEAQQLYIEEILIGLLGD